MTLARAGACVLSKKDGTLAGIFTHGDFVRAYSKDPLIGLQKVSDLMTVNPIFVRDTDLASQATKAASDKRIDDIVVLDKDNKPVGLVDLQDLARLKLV